MIDTGSQIVLCDVPVRLDTYKGCTHACTYCFAKRKTDIRDIKPAFSRGGLENFLAGKRPAKLAWADWNIPIHFGGMSDPFQPAEAVHRKSLEALELMAAAKHPVIISTKGKLAGEPEYLDAMAACECVLQISMVCSKYDRLEPGAATWEERLEIARKASSRVRRVIARVQPYTPHVFTDVLAAIPKLADAGVYGIIFEGMKTPTKPKPNGYRYVKVCGEYCYDKVLLAGQFMALKNACHAKGMRAFAGENRIRELGDDLCCCGIEGLGWRGNTCNLNHMLYDPDGVFVTPAMQVKGSADAFGTLNQATVGKDYLKAGTFEGVMRQFAETTTARDIYGLDD